MDRTCIWENCAELYQDAQRIKVLPGDMIHIWYWTSYYARGVYLVHCNHTTAMMNNSLHLNSSETKHSYSNIETD